MTDLEELVASADRLCSTLEDLANQDRRFCAMIQHNFDELSYQAFVMSENLKSIKDYCGV